MQKELDFANIPLPEITTSHLASPHQPPSLDFEQLQVSPNFVDWTADPNSTHGRDQLLSDEEDEDMDLAEQPELQEEEADLQKRADALLGPSEQQTPNPTSTQVTFSAKIKQPKSYLNAKSNKPYKSQIICRLDKNTVLKK